MNYYIIGTTGYEPEDIIYYNNESCSWRYTKEYKKLYSLKDAKKCGLCSFLENDLLIRKIIE